MTFSTLDEIEAGSRVFIDASIFIYHSTAVSFECRRLLERCEQDRIAGFTSVTAIAEVAHRLMMIEAVSKGLVSPGNVARKLRDKPEVIKKLQIYQDQVEVIPLLGVSIFGLDPDILTLSAEIRQRYGLLVNDSLLAATAIHAEIGDMASADSDFSRVTEFRLFRPGDF